MVEKIFIPPNKKAEFVCPKCKKTKLVDISRYRNLAKASKIKCKCPCGHSYTAIFATRKNYRKTTNLRGVYIHIVSNIGDDFCEEIGKGVFTICDISTNGVQIKLNTEQAFAVGERLLIEFNLDDPKKTSISKDIVIKSIHGIDIGAEFFTVDPSDPNDKAIESYLSGL